MKKIIVFFIIFLIVFSCKKDNKTVESTDPVIINENSTDIDFNHMENLVKNSSKLDIEIFFAISVLHKRYISQFIDQVKDKSEDEQKSFFLQKKKVFFDSIQYSEEEYDVFMANNFDQMNEYINSHKQIQEYLTSIH